LLHATEAGISSGCVAMVFLCVLEKIAKINTVLEKKKDCTKIKPKIEYHIESHQLVGSCSEFKTVTL